MGTVGRVAHFMGPLTRIGNTQGRHDHQAFAQTTELAAGIQNSRQTRVYREASKLRAERGQFALGIQCAYLLQDQIGIFDQADGRRLGESETLDVGHAHGLQLQHHAGEIGALDLGLDAWAPR